jgi:hypothetical protein
MIILILSSPARDYLKGCNPLIPAYCWRTFGSNAFQTIVYWGREAMLIIMFSKYKIIINSITDSCSF